MSSLNNNATVIDCHGVSYRVINVMNKWRSWLVDDDITRPFCHVSLDNLITRREAEYVVECLQAFLHLETTANTTTRNNHNNINPQRRRNKTTILSFYGDQISDQAIAVFCNFFLRGTPHLLYTLYLYCLPPMQLHRLFESLYTNTSIKHLKLAMFHHDYLLLQVIDLIQHKTDLTIIEFHECNGMRIASMQRLLSTSSSHGSSLMLLQQLEFYDCVIGDEGVGFIHQAIHEGNLPLLEDLSVHRNGITSISLPLLAELVPAVFPQLQKLNLSWNQGLFNDLQGTRHFIQNMLLSNGMMLKELGIRWCGQHTPLVIAACENVQNKLQVLDVYQSRDNAQPIIDQLVASLPKMKSLKSFQFCPTLLFDHRNGPAIMKALHKNSSIVKLLPNSDTPNRHRIALLLDRNQGLEHADALLLFPHPQTGLPIPSKSGIWYMAFAKLTQLVRANDLIKKDLYGIDHYRRGIREEPNRNGNRAIYTGASAVFKILQKRPAILEKQLKRPPGGGAVSAKSISSSTATAVVVGSQQTKRARVHSSSAKKKAPDKTFSSSSATTTVNASMMVEENNTDKKKKKKMLDSMTREELIAMILQKEDKIAEQASEIVE